MTERYAVRMRKAVHVFCAGHFITLTDTLCEPVHGHNWTAAAEVEGDVANERGELRCVGEAH